MKQYIMLFEDMWTKTTAQRLITVMMSLEYKKVITDYSIENDDNVLVIIPGPNYNSKQLVVALYSAEITVTVIPDREYAFTLNNYSHTKKPRHEISKEDRNPHMKISESVQSESDDKGSPGVMPGSTEEFLRKQLSYWEGIEKTSTDPIVQRKATDKVNAITMILQSN